MRRIGWVGPRAAGEPRYMRLARAGAARDAAPVEGAGDAGDCRFEELGLTRESWAGLAAEDQRNLVVRFLSALGSESTPEEIAADVGALPDAAARLAYLEAKTGCRVPEGAAPGGGEGPGAGPTAEGAGPGAGGGPVVVPSTTAADDLTPEKADEVRDAAAEPERWVLTPAAGTTRRGRGGLLLVAALAAYALTRRRA